MPLSSSYAGSEVAPCNVMRRAPDCGTMCRLLGGGTPCRDGLVPPGERVEVAGERVLRADTVLQPPGEPARSLGSTMSVCAVRGPTQTLCRRAHAFVSPPGRPQIALFPNRPAKTWGRSLCLRVTTEDLRGPPSLSLLGRLSYPSRCAKRVMILLTKFGNIRLQVQQEKICVPTQYPCPLLNTYTFLQDSIA